MAVGEELVFDMPDNVCFGCSPHNDRGLHLRFRHVAPSEVEGQWVAPDHTCGAPGIIHGGIQAVVLDEAIGFAIQGHHQAMKDDIGLVAVVTVEFDLRYRRPAPAGVELTARAEVVHVSERGEYLTLAELRGPSDELLTSATARWRRVDRPQLA